MKLCRYGEVGSEKPAAIDGNGKIRDLSKIIADLSPAMLAPGKLAELAEIDLAALPEISGEVRMAAPLTGTSKFIAIGLNYRDHAQEAGLPVPDEPIIFLKATTCISGPYDPIIQPLNSTKLDWEVELGVVIGSKARYVSEEDALDHVAGYCVVNDVSERAFQFQGSQWDKGKGCDSFGPIGPWIVTRDEVPDPQNLDMWLEVNGERKQSGNSSTMIFSVAELIAYCSRYMTLLPGDVICTGTPPGVGMARQPDPQWLWPGDRVRLGIQGLGMQEQTVVAFSLTAPTLP